MHILPLLYDDIHSITALQPEGWGDIFQPITFYSKNDFCFPVKVIIDDVIVGIGTTIIHHDVAWLAHIIVHPGHRNKGIGKLITETLVESLQEKNCDTIYLIATDLGAPVYEKVGFETETEYLFFKDVKAIQSPVNAKNIIPYTSDFKTEVANIDRQVSGEDRMFHLEQYIENGYVYLQNNIVEGFYLPVWGEGLVVAKTATAGIELMKLRFTTKDTVVFPIDNLNASALLYKNNYKEFRRAKRMRQGKKRNWQPENIYGRIGGNLG